MSSIYEVHVGPYVECKTKTVQTQIGLHACVNENCSAYGERTPQGPFCSKCAQEIGTYYKDVEVQSPDIEEILDNDTLSSVLYPLMGNVADHMCESRKIHIYIPNTPDLPGDTFDPRDTFDFREITPDRINEEIRILSLAPELKPLQDLYGAENVTVKWGVLNHVC